MAVTKTFCLIEIAISLKDMTHSVLDRQSSQYLVNKMAHSANLLNSYANIDECKITMSTSSIRIAITNYVDELLPQFTALCTTIDNVTEHIQVSILEELYNNGYDIIENDYSLHSNLSMIYDNFKVRGLNDLTVAINEAVHCTFYKRTFSEY